MAFLYDAGVRTTEKMVDCIQCKLDDYGLDRVAWQAMLQSRTTQLISLNHLVAYKAEMTRFLPVERPLIKTETDISDSFHKVISIMQSELLRKVAR